MRPVLLKIGGSVLTDKARERTLAKAALRRLMGELAKAEVPLVLLHGAGSFGHPQVARAGDPMRAKGVSDVLAAVGRLHAEVVDSAHEAGLKPFSIPLHVTCESEGDDLVGLPVTAIERALSEGHMPVLSGTIVRDAERGWRVVSADELIHVLSQELRPRLCLFATDVDGVFDRHPEAPGAVLLPVVKGRAAVDRVAAFEEAHDVTGAMRGKLLRALAMAEVAPVMVVGGHQRGRVLEALRGKNVPGTRIEA